jgi:polyphosphate:AMP phosphotransferase
MFDSIEAGAKIKKEDFEQELPAIRVELLNLQFDLQERDLPVIVVLAGPDRRGCAELFQNLHEWLDARRIDAHAFEVPSEEERERPRYWRWWKALPRRGRMGIFLGDWTWTAIARRVLRKAKRKELERSVERIRSFERLLVSDGALLVKLWLHIPKKKLAKRVADREECDRRVRWIEPEDKAVLAHYDEGIEVAEQVLRATDQSAARWHLVESTDREHRDREALRVLLDALRERVEGGDGPLAAARVVEEAPSIAPSLALARVDLRKSLADELYEKELAGLQDRAFELSRAAYERGLTSVLVFEGPDAAGKGGAIRRLTQALDARHFRVVPISAPTEEERAYHYLWRFWTKLPRAGRVVVFDRSWYGRVLVERVEGFAKEDEWRRAYEEILEFEAELIEHGILLTKFWLHIDEAEQQRRFAAREDTPYKKYKIGAEDYRNRAKWRQYAVAADEMFRRTSTPEAPWHLVPANDKRWARVEVLRTFCERLEAGL